MRKSSVCTLTALNPGFGGTWDILWIFFGYGTFIMLQKKSFGKKINNFIHGFKSAILAGLKNWQNGTFETEHEIQKILWPKDFVWSIMKEVPCPKNIHNMSQGHQIFSKRTHNISKIGFLWIPSKPGKQNSKVPFLLMFNIVKKTVCSGSMLTVIQGSMVQKSP